MVICVDFKNIEAVVLVDLYNGFSKASHATGIPVSTLSKRVLRLESELGMRLFDRSTASDAVVLTEHGQVLVPELQQILNTLMFLRQHFSDASSADEDCFSVGMLPMLAYKKDNILLSLFHAEHPESDVSVVVKSSNELVRLLQQANLDCAFLLGSPDWGVRGWESELLLTDEFERVPIERTSTMMVALSEEDPLSRRKQLTFGDLRNHTIIFNRWAEEGRRARGMGVGLFEECGCDSSQFDIFYEDFTNREYLFDLISLRRCALPLLSFNEMEVPGIRFVPLSNWNLVVTLFFVYRKTKSGGLSKFLDLISRELSR